jgi:hypothetical protein
VIPRVASGEAITLIPCSRSAAATTGGDAARNDPENTPFRGPASSETAVSDSITPLTIASCADTSATPSDRVSVCVGAMEDSEFTTLIVVIALLRNSAADVMIVHHAPSRMRSMAMATPSSS